MSASCMHTSNNERLYRIHYYRRFHIHLGHVYFATIPMIHILKERVCARACVCIYFVALIICAKRTRTHTKIDRHWKLYSSFSLGMCACTGACFFIYMVFISIFVVNWPAHWNHTWFSQFKTLYSEAAAAANHITNIWIHIELITDLIAI